VVKKSFKMSHEGFFFVNKNLVKNTSISQSFPKLKVVNANVMGQETTPLTPDCTMPPQLLPA
jgi:hypothetical protein